MSDSARGPGWWLASDGKWYSPDSPPPPPAPKPAKRRGPLLLVVLIIAIVLLVAAGVALGLRSSDSSTTATTATTKQASSSASSATTTTTTPAVGDGYLAEGQDYVVFLQWNNAGGQLSGSAQEITASGQPPKESVSTNTLPITGTLSESSISLSFSGSPQSFGTIEGNSVTLNVPQSDGSLAPITFNSAPATSFNMAVASLRSSVGSANQLATDQNAISSAASAVVGDIGEITELGSNAISDAQGISPALQREAIELGSTQQLEQQVVAEAGTSNANESSTCGDAGDADSVAGDADSVEGDAETVEYVLNQLRTEITTIQSDYSTLTAAEAELPSYLPSGTPGQDDVGQAISQANNSISSALSTANGDIDQANADVTTAYQYAADANQAGNCGSAPSAPAAQPHIS